MTRATFVESLQSSNNLTYIRCLSITNVFKNDKLHLD